MRSSVGILKPAGELALEPLSTCQRELLHAFEDSEAMTLSELIGQLDASLSERTVRRDLTQLQQLGLIALKGFGRGAKWQLINKRTEGDKRGHLSDMV